MALFSLIFLLQCLCKNVIFHYNSKGFMNYFRPEVSQSRKQILFEALLPLKMVKSLLVKKMILTCRVWIFRLLQKKQKFKRQKMTKKLNFDFGILS